MTGRRAIFGLCTLCAMAFIAIGAQAASAGQTAFTCANTATTKDFSSEHCVPGETGTSFGHVAITEETHAKISNESGRLHGFIRVTFAAIPWTYRFGGNTESLGTLKNEEVGGEMRETVTTDANGMTQNGVVVESPANKGCKVFEDNAGVKGAEGVIKTKPLTMHTIANGAVEEVIIEPVTSNEIATFFLECEKGKGVPEEVEGTWKITGSMKCPTHGATISCEHNAITTQNTLKAKGAKAGFEGKTTITAGKFPITEPTLPVSVTTTTP